LNPRIIRGKAYKIRRAILKLIIFAFSVAAFLPSKDIQTYLVHDDELHNEHLMQAQSLFEGTLQRFFILSYSIDSLEADDSPKTLTAYTLFGLPYLEIIVDGDDAYINRKLLFK